MDKIKKIFVIEDSSILSRIIELQLRQEFNCETTVFKNADDAMIVIKLSVPDLIVLDYIYNERDRRYANGLEFLKELRKKYDVPVIVFSGQSDKQKAIELIKEGANDYINKDDDDFMDDLLAATKDIFDMQFAKKKIKSFRSKLKINFLFLGLLLFLSAVMLKYI
ncbi:MAG: DNA-binding NtrC family response regulator [Glaciecola sp.]|jgi:DNA-binding NtrC family response regulator